MTTADKEDVRSRNPIIDVVGEYVELKRKGNWMMGCCPFHEEQEASFAIKIGSDHYCCFSCGASGDVFRFIQDIKNISFPEALKLLDGGVASNGVSPVRRTPKVKMEKKPTQYFTTYANATDHIKTWKHLRGYSLSNWYWYGDHCAITRWEHPVKPKQFFPISRGGEKGWFIGRPKGKLEVYNRDKIQTSFDETIFWVEGEKAADCATDIGLLASTSAGGANGFSTTNFTSLAGRRVLILPDNGPRQKRRDGTVVDIGLAYAESVKSILLSLSPPCEVYIFRLSGLPEGGDLVDWCEARQYATKTELIEMLRQEYKQQQKGK